MSCGHKLTVDAEALTRMQRIAADYATPSKPNPPMAMRCSRCGKLGVVRALSALADRVAAPLPPNPRPETRPENVYTATAETPPRAAPAVPVVDVPEPAPEPATASAEGGPRILIGGGPRTGKTTLADHLDAANALHTDDLINQHDWSAVSHEVATVWMVEPGPWIIEGVATVRALRKRLEALANDPTAKPCDLFVWLTEPKLNRTARQDSMAKGAQTVFDQIRPDLEARGVRIEIDPG